jgi:uncharacterized protein (TIGR02270 family)
MAVVSAPTQPFRDVVDESLDEATFLWRRWEAELTSLTRNLDEIFSWTEDRLQGSLDGVRVAGASLVDIATEGLLSDDVDRMVVCAAALAPSSDRSAVDAIATALAVSDGDKLDAIVRALELLGSDHALRTAASVLAARGPAQRAALCRLKAFRRVGPGEELFAAFKSDVPAAQVEAVRSALYVQSKQAEQLIADAMLSDDPAVRAAAVETGIARGIHGAWETAARGADRLNTDAARYLKLVALFGKSDDHEVIYSALRIPALQPQAIWALGHLGTVRAAEACLAGMQYEKIARACGEAYCWITGADLARDGLAAVEAPPDIPEFEDDDLDANLVPSAEEMWPLPNVESVREHWRTRREEFAPEARHVYGRPAKGATLVSLIEKGPMLRRPDLVLELRVKTHGRYDVETRAFTARQRQMMTKARTAVASHGGR